MIHFQIIFINIAYDKNEIEKFQSCFNEYMVGVIPTSDIKEDVSGPGQPHLVLVDLPGSKGKIKLYYIG